MTTEEVLEQLGWTRDEVSQLGVYVAWYDANGKYINHFPADVSLHDIRDHFLESIDRHVKLLSEFDDAADFITL